MPILIVNELFKKWIFFHRFQIYISSAGRKSCDGGQYPTPNKNITRVEGGAIEKMMSDG